MSQLQSKRPSDYGLRNSRLNYRIPVNLKLKFCKCIPKGKNPTQVTEILYHGFITGQIKLDNIKANEN